jgi:bifunctional non-homologous end joining protein LigD
MPRATASAPATVRAGRRAVAISHPDKVLFPGCGATKLDLARYHAAIAGVVAPHVRGRPLALQAFPDGVAAPGFFLKAIPRHFPDWIARASVPKRGGTVTHVVADDPATMVYLAGQNVTTAHTWLSRADEPHVPDRLIIDLDPAPGVRFATIRAAARAAGERLRDAGLVPFAMVTGSRGIHVTCPLRRGPGFEEVHAAARAIAEAMVADDPRNLTVTWRKDDRGTRIYVDVNRIGYAQHAVAPYAVRARPDAPVALPIRWEELDDRRLRPDGFSMAAALDRVAHEGDAWQGIGRRARLLR